MVALSHRMSCMATGDGGLGCTRVPGRDHRPTAGAGRAGRSSAPRLTSRGPSRLLPPQGPRSRGATSHRGWASWARSGGWPQAPARGGAQRRVGVGMSGEEAEPSGKAVCEPGQAQQPSGSCPGPARPQVTAGTRVAPTGAPRLCVATCERQVCVVVPVRRDSNHVLAGRKRRGVQVGAHLWAPAFGRVGGREDASVPRCRRGRDTCVRVC